MTADRRVRATQRRGGRPRRLRPCRCRIGHSPQTMNVRACARVDRDRKAVGHNAQRRLPASCRCWPTPSVLSWRFAHNTWRANEDLVGRLQPHEGTRVLVPGGDPGADVALEAGHARVGAALDLLRRQLGERALDEVEPGRPGRGEVEMEAWVAKQTALDRRGLVGGVVVEDEVDGQVGGHLGVDRSRNARNSLARWRLRSEAITAPLTVLSAANRLVVPWRT